MALKIALETTHPTQQTWSSVSDLSLDRMETNSCCLHDCFWRKWLYSLATCKFFFTRKKEWNRIRARRTDV